MDKLGEYSLLYDFYGELLTDKQRQIYEEVKFKDLSLSEAAEIFGVSRQGVHDTVRRVEEALDQYEETLGLVRQFRAVKEKTERIREICGKINALLGETDEIAEILKLTEEIEEL
ncbi:MAG: DNA-binding protein [Lachnospiraceae bacterium]|nr:DNA-binding protein [Lachnospiraceae bacterium]